MASAKKKGWGATIKGMIPGGRLIGGLFSLLGAVLRSRIFWIFFLIGFVLFLALILGIMSTAPQAPPPSQDGLPDPPPVESWWALIVRYLSMILLVAITVFLVRIAYQDCFTTPAPDKKSPDPEPKFDWAKARKNSVLILAFAVPVFNIFLGALATETWIWWFNHFTLFVFANLGVIVAGHFYDKGNKLNQGVAFVILFLILVGFFGALASDVRKKADEYYAKAKLGLGDLSLPNSPFSGSSPALVQLTTDEQKATTDALMKLPLAERKVLWVLFQCDPENESFRPDKKGELGATKTYRSKGAEAFGKTCVDMLVRARLIFTLAVVDATPSGSKLVSLPEMFGYETTATGPDGETGYAMEAVTREDGQISALRLTAKGTKNVRVTLTCHPATKRADSP